MDILSFHKITKPIHETGATIDLSPKGMWHVAIRRTDGTHRYPFGDHWLPNLFINRFADGLLGGGLAAGAAGVGGTGFSWHWSGDQYWVGDSWNTYSFIHGYFFGTGQNRRLAVGSSGAAVSATQTALQSQVRADSVPSSGNNAAINFTTGGITYTIAETFPTETGTVVYREAAIRQGDVSSAINNIYTNGIFNRIVFPGDVTLNAGESLTLKLAITIQSAAGTDGIPISLAAQNGMNVSGKLKLIGSEASILGGTVTSNGATTINRDYPLLFSTAFVPVGNLSTLTSFSTQGTNPTWGNTNQVSGAWSAYSNGTRFRDATFLWGTNIPSSDTGFRSILMRSQNTTGSINNTVVRGGYQLLLDNEMTKATTATLAVSLRFAV